jgi:hypothetical protein
MLSWLWNKFASPKGAPPLENCALHYVWVPRHPPSPRGGGPLCAVPFICLDKAFGNARRCPETPVTLWLDYARIDDMTRFFVESHAANNAPPNMRLRNLHEIPAYAQNPVFVAQAASDNLWARVDLARLLVLSHAFDTTEAQNLFYSDFDVEDVKLADPVTARILQKHGMFFGSTDERFSMIENSYLAFRRGAGERFLKDYLIPATAADADRKRNGYGAFTNSIARWSRDHGVSDLKKKLCAPRVHPSGHPMPANALYRDLGIN